METQKPKVDVAAIVAKAKQKTQAVKESTERLQSKSENYKVLPNFTKYEFNGIVLRNVKTKNIVSMKTGRTKYQIHDDSGKSHNMSKEEILALFPDGFSKLKKDLAPKKEKAQKKEKAPKKEKAQRVALNHEEPKESVNEILSMQCKAHKKHFLLHLKGKSNKEIHELTKDPIPSIARDIWRYKSGKTILV